MQTRSPRNRKTRNDIIEYMLSFAHQYGRQPSIREIGAAIGLSSTSTTAGYLNRMVRDGILGKAEGRYRSYFVIEIPTRQ